MYKDHRIDRRRIVFVVLTLTHIISYQLIECLTIGGDYENGEYTFHLYICKHKTIITLHTYITQGWSDDTWVDT